MFAASTCDGKTKLLVTLELCFIWHLRFSKDGVSVIISSLDEFIVSQAIKVIEKTYKTAGDYDDPSDLDFLSGLRDIYSL